MIHKNYYEISAASNYELGVKRGELFGEIARSALERRKNNKHWEKKVSLSGEYLTVTEKYFPNYIDELKGYAKASNILFEEFWTMSLEDDFDYLDSEKCTTVVTNNGKLLSHNEDWPGGAEDALCVLKSTVNDTTRLELYYYNTLGGCSISVNSHGYVMGINTLMHIDRQVGVPRNIIARWLSETRDISKDFEKLQQIPRSRGYNHVFTNTAGQIVDIECSATKQVLLKPSSPYVHTNHFLSDEMKSFENTNDSTATIERYNSACSLMKDTMSMEEVIQLNSNNVSGDTMSILNKGTIGKMVVDVEQMIAKVWLKRENELGWVDYQLDFIR